MGYWQVRNFCILLRIFLMVYGFLNKNDYGDVLVDDTFMNLSYKTKGVVGGMSGSTFNINYGGGDLNIRTNITFWVVDYPGTNPILAVAPLSTNRLICTVDCLNETSTANPPPAGYSRLVFFADGTTLENLTYYVFDNINPSGLLNTGWGMQLIGPSGDLIFHSSLQTMRLKDSVVLRATTQGQNIVVSSLSTYAFVFSNQTLGSFTPYGTGVRVIQQAGLKRTSSTNLQIGSIPYWGLYNQVGAGPLEDNNPAPAMIIDVTGL